MFRFAIKAGIATSAVYYMKEEGVWQNSEETVKVYRKINANLEPYVQEAKKQLPFEIPTVQNTEKLSFIAAEYWNMAVITTFKFLSELPQNTCTLADNIWSSAISSPDIQKLIDATFSKSDSTNESIKLEKE